MQSKEVEKSDSSALLPPMLSLRYKEQNQVKILNRSLQMLAWNSKGRESRREGIRLGATLRWMMIEAPALEGTSSEKAESYTQMHTVLGWWGSGRSGGDLKYIVPI